MQRMYLDGKMKLIIKAPPRYAKRMFKHLRKEHPSTRRRMTLVK
jgi:hypothetical protein